MAVPDSFAIGEIDPKTGDGHGHLAAQTRFGMTNLGLLDKLLRFPYALCGDRKA
jgi:hypothetical protein